MTLDNCYLFVIKGNGQSISFSFQMQNMNYMSTSDLYPQSLKESNCAFKETDDISTDAWTAYLYNNHMIVCDVTRSCSLLGSLSSGKTSLILTGE